MKREVSRRSGEWAVVGRGRCAGMVIGVWVVEREWGAGGDGWLRTHAQKYQRAASLVAFPGYKTRLC